MLLRLLLTLLISVNSEPVFSYWQRFVQAILMAGRRHKKLNLLNFQTQSIKFYSKTCYKDRLTSNLHLHSKYISLLGFFFKLSICPPNVKRSTFFRGFTIWPPPPSSPPGLRHEPAHHDHTCILQKSRDRFTRNRTFENPIFIQKQTLIKLGKFVRGV